LRERHWNSKFERLFGLVIFICLKLSGLSRAKLKEILAMLKTSNYCTAELYAHYLIVGDKEGLLADNRGKYQRFSIFENYPELKDYLLEITIVKVSTKVSTFSIKSFIENGHKFIDENHLCADIKHYINYRSTQNFLHDHGFRFSNNKIRPFIDGHERDDVIERREFFINYLHDNLKSFWVNIKLKDGSYFWQRPEDPERIVIAHDESTIRSGDTQTLKWLHQLYSPMFNKGSSSVYRNLFYRTYFYRIKVYRN
jgi:hypothetical protein